MEIPAHKARIGLALWLCALIVASYFPFRPGYGGPYRAINGAAQSPGGALHLREPSIVRTAEAPAWLGDALEAETLDVSIRAQAARPDQLGPARLVTLSEGAYERSFMVAQKGEDLVVRARRPGADKNGAPPIKVDGVFRAEASPMDPDVSANPWRDIHVQFRADRISVFVDGKRRMFEDMESSPFALWDPGHRLAFGDEVDGARAWDGQIDRALFTVGDRVHDGLAQGAVEMPESVWHVPQRTRMLWIIDASHTGLSGLIHIFMFLPLGALAVFAYPGRMRSGSLRRAALMGLWVGLFSATIQLGKLLFESRHPSLIYALPDATGALLGALIARKLRTPS